MAATRHPHTKEKKGKKGKKDGSSLIILKAVELHRKNSELQKQNIILQQELDKVYDENHALLKQMHALQHTLADVKSIATNKPLILPKQQPPCSALQTRESVETPIIYKTSDVKDEALSAITKNVFSLKKEKTALTFKVKKLKKELNEIHLSQSALIMKLGESEREKHFYRKQLEKITSRLETFPGESVSLPTQEESTSDSMRPCAYVTKVIGHFYNYFRPLLPTISPTQLLSAEALRKKTI